MCRSAPSPTAYRNVGVSRNECCRGCGRYRWITHRGAAARCRQSHDCVIGHRFRCSQRAVEVPDIVVAWTGRIRHAAGDERQRWSEQGAKSPRDRCSRAVDARVRSRGCRRATRSAMGLAARRNRQSIALYRPRRPAIVTRDHAEAPLEQKDDRVLVDDRLAANSLVPDALPRHSSIEAPEHPQHPARSWFPADGSGHRSRPGPSRSRCRRAARRRCRSTSSLRRSTGIATMTRALPPATSNATDR